MGPSTFLLFIVPLFGCTAHVAGVQLQERQNATGCERYAVTCGPSYPKDMPPTILGPWDVCVDLCVRDSENLDLGYDEQKCCNECDQQSLCCPTCHDPKGYGLQTAYKRRDTQICKESEEEDVKKNCEAKREKALANLEDHMRYRNLAAFEQGET